MFRSLKTRLLTIAILTFCLILGIQVYVRLAFEVPELKALEAISDRKDAARVNQAVEQTLKVLRTLAYEYANWDETFDFVKYGGQGFVAQSLIAGLIASSEIDGAHFYSNSWELLFACDRTAQKRNCDELLEVGFTKELQTWVAGFSSELVVDSGSIPSGIYQAAKGPVLFAAAPILDHGKNAGWLLFSRRVTDEQVAMWGKQESVIVRADWQTGSQTLPEVFGPSHDFFVQLANIQRDDHGHLHWAITDVFGEPRLFFTVEYDTSFVSQNLWSRSFMASVLFGCCLIAVMFFIVDRFLVIPLSRLATEVERIKLVNGFLDVQLSDPGSQEIAKISRQFNLLLSRVNDQYRLLQEQNKVLENASYKDQLTNLPNRRALDLFVDESWAQSVDNKSSMTMAMVDCDFFKQYNDTYGHDAGDEVLRSIGNVLNQFNQKNKVIAARYGGEEFCVVMQGASLDDAEAALESCRRQIEGLAVPHRASSFGKVTVSIGLAQINFVSSQHPKNLFRAADQALYIAKDSGRNCLFVSKVEIGKDSTLPPLS